MTQETSQWDELTPHGFLELREKSGGVCVLPIASIEQHGGHLPLGTDSFVGKEVCARAAALEPVMVFPVFQFGVNGEATAFPGAIGLGTEALFAMLGNLCDEIARNGFRKILLFSSHGGNEFGLRFFVQQWATKPHDYMVYYLGLGYGDATPPKSLPVGTESPCAHGSTFETSAVMAAKPETVRLEEKFPEACAANLRRLDRLTKLGVYTAVSYYANYPCHWAGPAQAAGREAGADIVNERARKLAEAVRAIKGDGEAPRLMQEFRSRASRGGTMTPENRE